VARRGSVAKGSPAPELNTPALVDAINPRPNKAKVIAARAPREDDHVQTACSISRHRHRRRRAGGARNGGGRRPGRQQRCQRADRPEGQSAIATHRTVERDVTAQRLAGTQHVRWQHALSNRRAVGKPRQNRIADTVQHTDTGRRSWLGFDPSERRERRHGEISRACWSSEPRPQAAGQHFATPTFTSGLAVSASGIRRWCCSSRWSASPSRRLCSSCAR